MSERIVRAHAGWQGQFTTDQQVGAWPNGTRIRKVRAEPGDLNKAGATGRVLGSLAHPDIGIGYFVEWEHLPMTAVFVMGSKLRPIPRDTGEPQFTHRWSRNTPL